MKRIAALGLCLVGYLTLGAACGSSGGTSKSASTSSSSSGATTGGGGGGPLTIACTSQPAQLDLGGTWAAYGDLSVTLAGMPGGAISICPANQVGEATLLLLISMQEDSASALSQVKATLCSVDLPVVTALVGTCDPTSQSLVSTQINVPPALIAALPNVPVAPASGTIMGTAPGSAVAIDRLTVDIGSSATGAALPSWEGMNPGCDNACVGTSMTCATSCVTDCSAMRDDDHDGYPGVTLTVCGTTAQDMKSGAVCDVTEPSNPGVSVQGRAFLDLQVDPLIAGTANSSCEITGTVDMSILYNIVGAQVDLEGTPISVSSAIASLPSFTVEPTSKFRMVRVDGKYGAPDWMADPSQPAAACAAVLAHANEL
jgi:hypothetical protein